VVLPALALHELVIVDDRILMDVVLAHCLSHVWTLAVHIAARLRLVPVQDSAPRNAGSSEVSGGKLPRVPFAVWTMGM